MGAYQYRIRWINVYRGGRGEIKRRFRYETRESLAAAKRVATAIAEQQEEDYCKCDEGWECGWCSGHHLPPEQIEIYARAVGPWEPERKLALKDKGDGHGQ